MKSTFNNSGATVTSIKRGAVAIVPPEGWSLHSPLGMLCFDSTESGRLVRIADLVLWLMKTAPLPCAVAVERVCNALESPDAANWLYLLDEAGYAKQLGAEHSFAYSPILSWWESEPPSSQNDVGLPGAIKNMREFWGTSSAPGATNWMGQHVLDPLAIRLDKAAELWGYGLSPTVGDSGHSADAVEEWTDKMLAEKHAFFKGDGKGKHTARLVTLSRIPAREITRRIKAYNEQLASSKKATPFSGLGDGKSRAR